MNPPTDTPKIELYGKLKERLGATSDSNYSAPFTALKNETALALTNLEKAKGAPVDLLPQTTIVRVPELGVFTLSHNHAYTNLSSLFREDKRRRPEEDTLTIAKGIIGSYPTALCW